MYGTVEHFSYGVVIPRHLATASELGFFCVPTASQGRRPSLNFAREVWHFGNPYTWCQDTLTLGNCFAASGPSFGHCFAGSATPAKSRARFVALWKRLRRVWKYPTFCNCFTALGLSFGHCFGGASLGHCFAGSATSAKSRLGFAV